jgi:hypothetical protein
MKKIGEYTVKGRLPIASSERITLFDGRFDTGYRVTKFVIAPVSNAGADDTYAKLATSTEVTNTSGHEWNWDSNLEIAWAKNSSSAGGNDGSLEFFIDSDNMIVQDLYIFTGTGSSDVNYMIHLEKYDITDWQGALAMVRNKSQG